jgi:hypothetical protein
MDRRASWILGARLDNPAQQIVARRYRSEDELSTGLSGSDCSRWFIRDSAENVSVANRHKPDSETSSPISSNHATRHPDRQGWL